MNTQYGPSDRIRTCGILLPKQARYQLRYTRLLSFLSGWSYSPKAGALPAALHPDIYFSARQHAFAHIVTHAVSGRQKNSSQADTKSQGVYPIKAAKIRIADFLSIVNSTHFKRNGAFCRTRFPRSRSAAACAFRLHRRQTCTFCNLRKIKFNTFFRNSQRFSALQFRVGCGMLYK